MEYQPYSSHRAHLAWTSPPSSSPSPKQLILFFKNVGFCNSLPWRNFKKTSLEWIYRKHRPISRTFLLKIFVSNRGCGLSARTSVHHPVNLHKLTLLKGILTRMNLNWSLGLVPLNALNELFIEQAPATSLFMCKLFRGLVAATSHRDQSAPVR